MVILLFPGRRKRDFYGEPSRLFRRVPLPWFSSGPFTAGQRPLMPDAIPGKPCSGTGRARNSGIRYTFSGGAAGSQPTGNRCQKTSGMNVANGTLTELPNEAGLRACGCRRPWEGHWGRTACLRQYRRFHRDFSRVWERFFRLGNISDR